MDKTDFEKYVDKIVCEIALERAKGIKKRTAEFGLMGFNLFGYWIKKALTENLGIVRKIGRLNANK